MKIDFYKSIDVPAKFVIASKEAEKDNSQVSWYSNR